MPVETKKVLWTVLSVAMVLVVASGMALALVYPRGSSGNAPATVAAVAPPRTASPDEYVREVQPAPVPVVPAPGPATQGSDVIIVYGDKPDPSTLPDAGTRPATLPSPAVTAPPSTSPPPGTAVPAQGAVSKPYSPAPGAAGATGATSSNHAAESRPTTTPPAARAPVTVTEYWIQAAAFTSRTRADELQHELSARGLTALITVKDLDGVTWYRVRIGPYRSEAEAKTWLEKVRTMAGCAEAYVSRQTIQKAG